MTSVCEDRQADGDVLQSPFGLVKFSYRVAKELSALLHATYWHVDVVVLVQASVEVGAQISDGVRGLDWVVCVEGREQEVNVQWEFRSLFSFPEKE